MVNREISRILFEMAELLEMERVLFKPRAYERASESVASFDADLNDLYKKGGVKALKTVPGVGEGIALKIEEYLKTGHIKEYERLKKKLPVNISELTAIDGVGPKAIKVLWQKLRIRNAADLERAARQGKIAKLPRFGKKSEEKILKGIEFIKSAGKRFRLGDMLPYIRRLADELKALPEVDNLVVAGSTRRWKETIGDTDILAISKKPADVMDYFAALRDVVHVYGKGETKTMVRMRNGLDVDLRVVPAASFGAALNYFTGSKDHNVRLREMAVKRGWKLNEYGLYKGTREIAGKTEEGLYKALGMDYIEPEMRENLGEIETALKHKLPKLIGYRDLKGDLQVQTDWTDGSHSIEEMAEAARKRGLEYIAITDHTKALAMTGGSDEKKLLKQMAYIDKLNLEYKKKGIKFRILKGAEVNIMPGGTLDINDETLAKLEVVGAAVHGNFRLSRTEQTRRVIRAMESPHVDIIFHLTGRLIQKRDAIDLDIDEVIRAAKRTRTVLEIDAHPDRLDLKDEHIRKARQAGVRLSIDSDAHSMHHYPFLEFGIAQARRGWCERRDIINAHAAEQMLKLLKQLF